MTPKPPSPTKTTEPNWKWFGNAGHFICAQWCRFHLCTQVGKYLVSSVGEYWPERGVREIQAKVYDPRWLAENRHRKGDDFDFLYMKKFGFAEIGCDRKYETMVFLAGKPCDAPGCGCGLPAIDGSELDSGSYNDAKSATEGHMELCQKYARKQWDKDLREAMIALINAGPEIDVPTDEDLKHRPAPSGETREQVEQEIIIECSSDMEHTVERRFNIGYRTVIGSVWNALINARMELSTLRRELALFKAKDQCLPPGFDIGDDLSAEFAIKIVELEETIGALRRERDQLKDQSVYSQVVIRQLNEDVAEFRRDCTRFASQVRELTAQVKAHGESDQDRDRLVRELDHALFGPTTARQARLCDLAKTVPGLVVELRATIERLEGESTGQNQGELKK